MTWTNISAINTNQSWQFSPEFSGEIVRLRHSVTQPFPYGVKGLIAQSFGLEETLELYNVKAIFPFYGNDILLLPNPFVGNQRIAIRGQTKFQSNIVWLVYLDLWVGESNSLASRLELVDNKIERNYQELRELRNLSLLILDNLGVTPPAVAPTTAEQEFFLIN